MDNEIQQFIKDHTATAPAFLIAENSSRPREPGRISEIEFVQVSYRDHVPVLCYKVMYIDGTGEHVPVAVEGQQIIDHHRENYFCRECRKDTLKNPAYDQYQVTEQLWKESGAGHHMLCITCFQGWVRDFVKRELNAADFPPHPLNDNNRFIKLLSK